MCNYVVTTEIFKSFSAQTEYCVKLDNLNYVKHPANNTQVALKASDLLTTNQAIGVSLKENTVKQESFNAQFEDEEHHGMSDWEITLINQRDSVEGLWKGEFF